MERKFIIYIGLFLLSICLVQAQENFPKNGVADERQNIYLLDNATIIPGGEQSQFVGDILIVDGKIKSVSTQINTADAVVINLEGYFVYPGFIDMYAQYGIDKIKREQTDGPQLQTNQQGAYGSNEAIRSHFNAYEAFRTNTKDASEWRSIGFGALLTHRIDGISRGSGSLVALADESEHEVILKEIASNHLSLKKGSSTQDYPGSRMGAMALLKQTYLDGQWYAKGQNDVNISLEKWNKLQGLPTIMEASNVLDVFRVDKIGDQFNTQYIIKGIGDEYKRLAAVKSTNAFMIIPVNFPAPIDAEDPIDAEMISLGQMKHWELAPHNLKMLEMNNIPFAITANGLKDKKEFLVNLKKAVASGLSEKAALNALTMNAANKLGLGSKIGSIENGKIANIIVTNQPLFEEKSKIIQNWVLGKPYQINPFNKENIDGDYKLIIGRTNYDFTISESEKSPKLVLHLNDTTDVNGDVTIKDKVVNIVIAFPEKTKNEGYLTLSGWPTNNGNFKGKGRLANGDKVDWKVNKIKTIEPDVAPKEEKELLDKDDANQKEEIGDIIYPFVAYGYTDKPKQQKVLFKNATVWTNEKDGILTNTDVLIDKGEIVKIGKDLNSKDAVIIDATGKHLTCGIIDEHSHIGIQGGVNEWTKTSSAEVSIGDVVNSEDVNFYRQLAGGVVAAQLLHGSANPIGGQSAMVKFRWGSLPEQMKIQSADPFIKFALGENVKQSNWGDKNVIRFPQTRMGVEQAFIDHFTRAKAYATNDDPNKRIDLELQSLAEIINSKRFITCHSYVQSEINMLMKVADEFDFTVNTFTHILEGYKVADKMKAHGAGASTFSDWWAYKYEVIDAIPYNASILNKMGVLTAINSDDAEMARRLNQEAAKAIKYGGMSEIDAWKMVTLNPAKLLHLDDKMGSIKVGKDADIVLWSDNPLSIYAKAEQTYVDGVKYFDLAEDLKLRAWIKKERARIIQKMLVEKKGGAKTTKVEPEEEKHYHCDDIEHWGVSED